jgi:hypothetical protein
MQHREALDIDGQFPLFLLRRTGSNT